VVRNGHLYLLKLKIKIMELNLKDVNDLYYVVGRMMQVDKKDRMFISDEELEVLSNKLIELIEVKYEEENY
jgi:hypothetical protein